MPDQNTRFLIANQHVRGQIVKLEHSYQSVLANAPYTQQVAELLGQALAAVAALGSIIKLRGSIIMQVQGEGAIHTLVAQANNAGEIRGLAHGDHTVKHKNMPLIEKGRLVMTVDAEGSQRYQGIVQIQGEQLSCSLKAYFKQSEQLPTHIHLAANAHHAACFLLQQLPQGANDIEGDSWHHIKTLSETLQSDELLSLEVEQILYRLFHEQEVTIFEPTALKFNCRCSRAKIEPVIIQMGYEDAMQLVQEQGEFKAQCEFCNRSHSFDQVDVAALFGSAQSAPDAKQ